MSKEIGRYDPNMEMFVADKPLELDEAHKGFLLHLKETGKFDEDMHADVLIFQRPTREEHMAQTGGD